MKGREELSWHLQIVIPNVSFDCLVGWWSFLTSSLLCSTVNHVILPIKCNGIGQKWCPIGKALFYVVCTMSTQMHAISFTTLVSAFDKSTFLTEGNNFRGGNIQALTHKQFTFLRHFIIDYRRRGITQQVMQLFPVIATVIYKMNIVV